MIEFQIDDMTCGGCASTITRAVRSLDRAAKVEIDLPARRVRVESPLGPVKLVAAIRSAGFTPTDAYANRTREGRQN